MGVEGNNEVGISGEDWGKLGGKKGAAAKGMTRA